jgi:DNA-binding MarR family transcriptional regulator|tara:strand:- start:153 stop:458 length:306 start_codon:yes stop_codon:yes gene_type:complete
MFRDKMLQELKFDKWVNVLIGIDDIQGSYTSQLSHINKITYCHTADIIKLLIKLNWIHQEQSHSSGRIKIITLTKEGKAVKVELVKIKNHLKQNINENSVQ